MPSEDFLYKYGEGLVEAEVFTNFKENSFSWPRNVLHHNAMIKQLTTLWFKSSLSTCDHNSKINRELLSEWAVQQMANTSFSTKNPTIYRKVFIPSAEGEPTVLNAIHRRLPPAAII